jgi:hypothetical protein
MPPHTTCPGSKPSAPRDAPPRSALERWLLAGARLDEPHAAHATYPWYRVLWLTGVDYFSSLGYQPGIALLAAGALAPLATVILVAVTLLGALPVYAQVARRSYAGQGSIAMLENQLGGWTAKIAVLVLLGFAATDFVITMTLSAADAAQHAVENPFLRPYLGEAQGLLTCALLALLAAVFLRGFSEAIGVATAVAVPYLVLNAVVLARGLVEIARRPDLLAGWNASLALAGDWTGLFLASALIFPKLALGMSGFETGVSVMPLVGPGGNGSAGPPAGRIRATRRLLAAAAVVMSVMLLGSSIVTTLLIPEADYAEGGPAAGRAVAHLAHLHLGEAFGTLYDLSTILILWFAGASAMAGLLNLVPRYLPRFGMAPEWIAHRRPLVFVIAAVALAVTWAFDADVEAQGSAYATGVLVLMLSAAVAVAIALWQEARARGAPAAGRAGSAVFWVISAVFAYTLADNVVERPDGVVIASAFVAGMVGVSAVSRVGRSRELRVTEIVFADPESEALWKELAGKKVNLVPLARPDPASRARKTAEIRRHYAVRGPVAFLHVRLLDNRSEFIAPLHVKARREDGDYVVEVSGAVAIANTIAYVSELIDPISLFLGLTRKNLMTQALSFLLWGEGETGLMVYAILVHHWERTVEEDVRPLIFLMSE